MEGVGSLSRGHSTSFWALHWRGGEVGTGEEGRGVIRKDETIERAEEMKVAAQEDRKRVRAQEAVH